MSREALLAVQHPAIREVVAMQEKLGLRSVTDGEFNRTSWQSDFLLKIGNVVRVPAKLKVRFHTEAGARDHAPPALEVAGKLSRPAPIFVDDFKFLKSVARGTPKVTMPSPSIVHFRGGRDAVSREAYPDMAEFYADLAGVYRAELGDLADAGCRYAQIDEVNLAYLCDPRLRADVAGLGEDPDAPAPHLRQAPQRLHRGPAGRHDDVHAPVPRQLRRRMDRGGRLRAHRRHAVQRDRRHRLFP